MFTKSNKPTSIFVVFCVIDKIIQIIVFGIKSQNVGTHDQQILLQQRETCVQIIANFSKI